MRGAHPTITFDRVNLRCDRFHPSYRLKIAPLLSESSRGFCEGEFRSRPAALAKLMYYFIACGLIGDPTARVIGNGGPQKKNSYTLSAAQSSAKSLR